MKIIEDKVRDRQFTKLIAKTFKAGYFEFRYYQHDLAGTPQGSIISPILSNIYLHQLDEFVMNLKGEFDIGTKPHRTSEYRRLEHLLRKAKKSGNSRELRVALSNLRKVPSVDFSDPLYKRLSYVRYADDWIIGIRGSYKDALNILSKVKDYCANIGLTVNMEKTKITSINLDRALFLGVNISRSRTENRLLKGRGGFLRRANKQLRFEAPLDRIKSKLRESGFIKYNESTERNI